MAIKDNALVIFYGSRSIALTLAEIQKITIFQKCMITYDELFLQIYLFNGDCVVLGEMEFDFDIIDRFLTSHVPNIDRNWRSAVYSGAEHQEHDLFSMT